MKTLKLLDLHSHSQNVERTVRLTSEASHLRKTKEIHTVSNQEFHQCFNQLKTYWNKYDNYPKQCYFQECFIYSIGKYNFLNIPSISMSLTKLILR